MKTKLLITLTATFLLLIPNAIFGQTITLGTAANFVLFSTNGAVSNSGTSQLTGNIGTNNGSCTGFGNVNGAMHNNDGVSAQCVTDLLVAYNQLDAAITTDLISSTMGNGATLFAGVYSVTNAATLTSELTLDGKDDPNAQFIFRINGSFSADAASKITLINGTQSCNVFWVTEGKVILAAGTSFKGTVIANNSAIQIGAGVKLEGRALSTTGAIAVDGSTAYVPLGCGNVALTGPVAPTLASTECYVLYSASGAIINTGTTTLKGDVGTNSGTTAGFDPLLVNGTIHATPDISTAQCAADLAAVYSQLNVLTPDINLLYPAQFGHSLVLTPHTYFLNAATLLTDTLFLNALGNANAVFVIQVNGALSTASNSNVVLINGAQSKNVFWKVEGAVSINSTSTFRGTIVSNNGAVAFLNPNALLDGRALTTSGIISVATATAIVPALCTIITGVNSTQTSNQKLTVTIAPNPISSTTTVVLNGDSKVGDYNLVIYSSMGNEVINIPLNKKTTTLTTTNLHQGIYFFKVMSNNKLIQSGKLISEN